VNGIAYVSGIRITILSSSKLPTGPLIDGAAVSVIGHTNAQGYVDVDSIEILPAGTAVPTGEPVELDSEDNSAGNGGSGRISESKIENESNNSDDGSEDKIDKQDQGEKVIGNSGSDDGGSDGSGDNNSGTSQSGKNDGNDDHGGGDNSGSGGGDDNSGSGGGDD
jgi:hypothetical protein